MITLPQWMLSVALWCALATLALATAWLLAVLVREWRAGRLW